MWQFSNGSKKSLIFWKSVTFDISASEKTDIIVDADLSFVLQIADA